MEESNEEVVEDEVIEDVEETSEETEIDYKAEAEKYKGIARRAQTKLAKLKETPAPVEQKKEIKIESKSSEPDYAKLAFLEQRGLTNPDDQKMVQEEAERLKMPLTDILGMEHIKSKLNSAKEQREAENGMPKGRGRGSGKTQQDVDYWLAKGETPDDLELANKVIDARMAKEKQGSKFADELYTG